MNTLEGNKLIAEFDGWQFGKLSGWLSGERELFYKKVNGEITETRKPESLEYHTSWDWLMPVVENIESLVDDKVGHITVSIYGNGCEIVQYDYKAKAKSFDGRLSKLLNTWTAVIQFIQWYNNQGGNAERSVATKPNQGTERR